MRTMTTMNTQALQKTILLAGIALMLALNVQAQNTDKAYSEKVRENATTFHKNFSSGDFYKNGALVNEKIYVNSNNAIVIGRDNFVNRIKRFHTPFPELELHDRIVIVDENEVGLLYIMQDEQDGPYGTIPASGNKINVYAAEFFVMDDEARMKELLTITQLDQLKKQITGVDKVSEFEKVSLLPIKKTNLAHKKMLTDNVEAYVQNFNTRDWEAFKALFAKNADININGKMITGAQALIDELNKKIADYAPDMTYHLEHNIVEGDRGALAYTIKGTHTFSSQVGEDGKPLKKSIQSMEGIHFQFNKKGKIIKAVIIYNSDDLNNQIH
ncbi:hypothetical protein FKX85_05735 [Echinicola soli]|uniref:SnoaL-like domain-containing protein n=1 Tax=Echinicola soli TaxID=2591634 RepID=A0A514CFI9_9BACT|nr:nuclear transport factor 2 family protein [Echinicola soli]QDH78558.1 hypothetical protein FKX85_05735 [Echinicola soli]